MDFDEARKTIWTEVKKFSDEVYARPQYWKSTDYHRVDAQWGALDLAKEPDQINLLYNKSNGWKFNHIEQYKILQRFKELMEGKFSRYYKRKEEI